MHSENNIKKITSNVCTVATCVKRTKKNYTKLGVVIYKHKLSTRTINIRHVTAHTSHKALRVSSDVISRP
jgi:hypothetical protein